MINQKFILSMLAALGGLLLLFVACQVPSSKRRLEPTLTVTLSPTKGQEEIALPTGCPQSFAITSTLPRDTSGANQNNVNCFAWQSFIALNWSSDPTNNGQPNPQLLPQAFGQPDDVSPTVWETYKATQDVFLPGAQAPAPWNATNAIPAACQTKAAAANLPHQSILYMTAKSSDDELFREVAEATGQILIDQTANLIRFEKRINQAEFDYITTSQLYNADVQANWVFSKGIDLPEGAIEIKAAWRRLDNAPANVKQRYKQTMAFLYDAPTNICSGPFTMGLIGLHIIRKTASMHQIMWSTFEQVDNVPGGVPPIPGIPYTLNNPNCQAPAPCTDNATPQPTPQPPAIPTYEPVQVHRSLPIPADVQILNKAVQTLITQANPHSVWQYYQLINVLWPQNNGTDPMPGAPTPINISTSGFTSSGPQPVSNVTLETYSQTNTCTQCHVFASIAPSQKAGCRPGQASDFSFVFDDADTPEHYRADHCKSN